jgi:hypothetical protein
MLRFAASLGLAVALSLTGSTVWAAGAYDWDELGAEFCRLTLSGDMASMPTVLSPSLIALVRAASANPALPSARTLFQTYVNEVPECRVRTLNAAIVEIQRSNAGGTPPAWTEYLVVTPERDGTTRIDDVLFATRRSDTLRTRLQRWAAGG